MTEEIVLNGLNWGWIALMVLAPPVVSLLAAWPFWRKEGMIFGNIVGTAIIFGTSFALIMREYVELDRATQACLDAGGDLCFPVPGAFERFAVYAFLGLVEVFALFALSLMVERRMRDRDYSPEWR
ncbi:MAG: hypothetical protein ABI603_09745 [Acidobacteriota bacterium]